MSVRSRRMAVIVTAISELLITAGESAAHSGGDHAATTTATVPGGDQLGLVVIALAAIAIARQLLQWRSGVQRDAARR